MICPTVVWQVLATNYVQCEGDGAFGMLYGLGLSSISTRWIVHDVAGDLIGGEMATQLHFNSLSVTLSAFLSPKLPVLFILAKEILYPHRIL